MHPHNNNQRLQNITLESFLQTRSWVLPVIMTWWWCWRTAVGYHEQPPRGYGDDTAVSQHDGDLVPALLRHELVRLVLGIVNISDTVAEKINNLYNICTWCPSGWHVAAKISANEFIVERFRLHWWVSAVGLTQAFMPWSKVSPRNLSTRVSRCL